MTVWEWWDNQTRTKKKMGLKSISNPHYSLGIANRKKRLSNIHFQRIKTDELQEVFATLFNPFLNSSFPMTEAGKKKKKILTSKRMHLRGVAFSSKSKTEPVLLVQTRFRAGVGNGKNKVGHKEGKMLIRTQLISEQPGNIQFYYWTRAPLWYLQSLCLDDSLSILE